MVWFVGLSNQTSVSEQVLINDITIVELEPTKMIKCLYGILCIKYGKPKSLAMSVSMVNIIESTLIRPRSNYLIKLKGNTETGEVYLHVDKKYSHGDVEAKVPVKHLKYTRWLPWLDYKVRVR